MNWWKEDVKDIDTVNRYVVNILTGSSRSLDERTNFYYSQSI